VIRENRAVRDSKSRERVLIARRAIQDGVGMNLCRVQRRQALGAKRVSEVTATSAMLAELTRGYREADSVEGTRKKDRRNPIPGRG